MHPEQNPQSSPVTGANQVPSSGWYPDPSGAPQQRYWDGAQWTGSTSAAFSPQNSGQHPGTARTNRSWKKWAAIGAGILALLALLAVWGNRPSREGQPGERATVSMPELQTGPAQDEEFLSALEQEGVTVTSRTQAQEAALAYCTSMIEGSGFVDSVKRIMEVDPDLGPNDAVNLSEAAEVAYCPNASLAGAPR